MIELANVTDWQAYLRDCIREPERHPELGTDLNIDAALSKVGADLKGTPRGAKFADAALALIEAGDPDEVRKLLQISLVEAPRAADRIAAVATKWRGTPLADKIGTLLLSALDAEPTNARVLAAFEADARIDGAHAIAALDAVVPYNIAWVTAHLDLLPASLDPDGTRLRFLALRTQWADLPALVAGIAKAGPDHVARFVGALAAADAPAHLVTRLRPILAAHPAFASAVP